MSHDESSTTELPRAPFSVLNDIISGFLVFLIAMPLCLAIAKASNYPPIAGIWTAVIGGVLCGFLSNSPLTIKGPAAGLIVIVAGSVSDFSEMIKSDFTRLAPLNAQVDDQLAKSTETASEADREAKRAALADEQVLYEAFRLSIGVGVVSGLVQVAFGLLKLGKVIDFFPLPAVHGMLASIGIIIIAKQSYFMLGVKPPEGADPLQLLGYLPMHAQEAIPWIAFIGIVSLVILFFFYFAPIRVLKKIPAQLVVLIFAILAPILLAAANIYELDLKYFVSLPNVLAAPSSAFAFPDFSGVLTLVGAKYLVLFALIGSLESLLSARAIDMLDPWKRKTNMDRDLIAVGVCNTLAGLIGGLPMISEIVRSSANINNGGQTSKANRFHGLFLLAFVLLFPALIQQIPLACLAAMLVFTGYRLASPNEFVKTYQIGIPQLIVFVGTIIVTLATDLLIGILAGVVIKIVINAVSGTPIASTFVAPVKTKTDGSGVRRIEISKSAVFSNWMGLQNKIVCEGFDKIVIVDLSDTRIVDHSVMEKLHDLESDFRRCGGELKVTGLERHKAASSHPTATRRKLPLPPGGNPFEKQSLV